MKKQTIALCAGLSLAALAFAPSALAASPTVSAGYTAAQLVDFLIPNAGPISVVGGTEAFGAGTTIGATPETSQAGIFAGGSAANNLPFSSGVVLTTGKLAGNAPPANGTGILGPNDSDRTSQGWGYGNGSAALEQHLLLPVGSTSDAASLSFQFTSTASSFTFQYMFASEEYAEYVGNNYNDAFAFLLTDMTLGPSSTVNLAVIGGSTPVSVNTINNGPTNSGPGSNPSYYTANPYLAPTYDIELDGMAGGAAAANKLFASANIIPGRTYKIELVIADSGFDNGLDSAIFIGEDAFQNPVPEPSTYVGALALAGLVARKLRRKA